MEEEEGGEEEGLEDDHILDDCIALRDAMEGHMEGHVHVFPT
jgi:hypothetical protein